MGQQPVCTKKNNLKNIKSGCLVIILIVSPHSPTDCKLWWLNGYPDLKGAAQLQPRLIAKWLQRSPDKRQPFCKKLHIADCQHVAIGLNEPLSMTTIREDSTQLVVTYKTGSLLSANITHLQITASSSIAHHFTNLNVKLVSWTQ